MRNVQLQLDFGGREINFSVSENYNLVRELSVKCQGILKLVLCGYHDSVMYDHVYNIRIQTLWRYYGKVTWQCKVRRHIMCIQCCVVTLQQHCELVVVVTLYMWRCPNVVTMLYPDVVYIILSFDGPAPIMGFTSRQLFSHNIVKVATKFFVCWYQSNEIWY